MAVTIKLRRALSSEWNSVNPVLNLGEPGYEIDTKKIKVGDGVNAWSNLEYVTQDFIDVVASGGLDSLTQPQQDSIKEGSLILTADGVRWFYKGSGSKTDPASYVQLADISPAWSQVTNVPSSLTGLAGIPSTLAGDIILASGNNLYYATSFAESVDDRLAQLLVGVSGIKVTYNDTANTLTLSNVLQSTNGISIDYDNTHNVVTIAGPTTMDGGEMVYSASNSSPLAFWTMNETVGSRKDVSGNGIDLYDGNMSTESTQGVVNTSARINNRNYLYANNHFGTRKTISLWIKLHSAVTSPVDIVTIGSSYIRLNSNNTIQWKSNIGNTNDVTITGAALGLNTWYHIVFVYDSAQNKCFQYQNGELINTVNVIGSLVFNTTDIFSIGPYTQGDLSLDCIGIWSRPLNNAEIIQLYNNGLGFSFNSLSESSIDESLFVNTTVSTPIDSLNISVAGSSGTMVPSFNTSTQDYCIKTNSTSTSDTISYTLIVDGVSIAGSSNINKLIKVSNGTKKYYIRLLPSDMPLGNISVNPTSNYSAGYYLVAGRRDTSDIAYNCIYNKDGIPVWYIKNNSSTEGLPQIFHPGNDKNKILIGRRGSTGVRYGITMTNNSLNAKQYNLLTTTKNGTQYLFDWQQHEFIELSGPPSRRGNILTVAFVPTPSTTTQAGQTAIANKAFGVYIQEQNPSGTQIVWDWWSGDYFNVGTIARTSSAFHLNAIDVHPITGDVICSFRGCSAMLCIEYATKNVKWVMQGPAPSFGTLQSMADPITTANTKFLTLQDEPIFGGFQYIGTAGQHHIKWKTNVAPLTAGNEVFSVFDNQTNFFAGNNTAKNVSSISRTGSTVTVVTSAAHGFATGDGVKIDGASNSIFNGVFFVTTVNTTTFTYTLNTVGSDTTTGTITAIKGTNYFPSAGPRARSVIYEIDLVNNKAIHRSSIFSATKPSEYLGSYTVLEHPNGVFSHVTDWNGEHPVLNEYADNGNGASPSNKTFEMDLPGDYYRIIKVPTEFFNMDYLRATTALPLTLQ